MKHNPWWFFTLSALCLCPLASYGMEEHLSLDPQPLTYDLVKAYEVQTQDIPKFRYEIEATLEEAKATTTVPGAKDNEGRPVSFNFGGHTYNLTHYALVTGTLDDLIKPLSTFLLERELSIPPEKFEIHFGKPEERVNKYFFCYEIFKVTQDSLSPGKLDYYISLMLERIQ